VYDWAAHFSGFWDKKLNALQAFLAKDTKAGKKR